MDNTLTKKKRIEELDMIKGIGIVMVCLQHISEITGLTVSGQGPSTKIMMFAEATMLLFFLSSGYVYSPKGTIIQDITNKFKQLIVTILKFGVFNTAVYFLRYIIIEHRPFIWFLDNTITNFLGLDQWNVRLGQITANSMLYGFVPFWFVIELFTAFCLFIPLYRLLEKKHVAFRIGAAAILMAIATALHYFDIQHTVADTFGSNVPYYFILINIFGFASVLMIGNLLKEVKMFDLEAHHIAFNIVCTILSLAGLTVIYILYEYTGYALQYGKWGPFGCISVPITTLSGFMLLFVLVVICYFLKRIGFIKNAFSFIGKASLHILALHYMIAETICWIGGYWHDIYNAPFPPEDFKYSNWIITIIGTAIVIGAYLAIKVWLAKRKSDKPNKVVNAQ